METDISIMFKEKNKEIFKNSLQLEMERNLDNLKQTIENCATLEINKVIGFLKEYFKEEKVKWSESELKETLDTKQNKILDIINSYILKKENSLKEYFESEYKDILVIEKDYIDKYYKKIDELSKDILIDFEKDVRKEISTNLTPEILNKYHFKKENQIKRIKVRVDIIFAETLTKRIKKEILFRDDNLKNMCEESFKKYLNLNIITA